MSLSKILARGYNELIRNARIIGMWELLVIAQSRNLLDLGELRALREIIKEKEKEYDSKAN